MTGVSSGVGVAALQTAKALGAKVIGTSGSARQARRARALGLDVALVHARRRFRDAVLAATGGKGANLVVNTVGGSVFAECVRALAFEGRLATVGYVDGVLNAEIDIEALHAKRLRCSACPTSCAAPSSARPRCRGFVADVAAARSPTGASVRSSTASSRSTQLAEAKARMEANAHLGKIVVRMPGGG